MGRLLGAAAVALTLLLTAHVHDARAADYTLKFGLVTRGDMQNVYGDKLKEVLEAKTNGKIEVKVFPASQLGTPQAQIEGMQLGTIEAFMVPADFFVGVDSRFGVFSIPLLFKSREHAGSTVMDSELNKEILALGESKGLWGGAVAVAADAKYFAKKPITRLDDFKGMKLRVNATPAERERMKRFGATAVPMPLSEMLTSLQSGVIDGTMSGISIYTNFNLHTVSTVLTETQDTMLVCFAAFSKKWLDGLPADLRKIVMDEARGLQEFARQQGLDENKTLAAKWAERGGKIINLPPEDMVELKKRLETVGEDVTKADANANGFYKRVQAVAAKY